MKKKVAIIGSTVLLLTLGGVAISNLYNLDWKIDAIFATPANKQLAWLKEHEKEIVAWIHSKHPKINSVEFDWETMEVSGVSNGIVNMEYNLSVRGTFNNDENTIIFIDFGLEKPDSIPNMSGIRMNQPPRIRRNKVLYIFE
jgi:lipoprotein